MSEIKRLLRMTIDRNAATEYISSRYRIKKKLQAAFLRKAAQESISANVILEAVIRGFVSDHPAVLAMIDQWIKDEGKARDDSPGPRVKKSELDEIYAAIGDPTDGIDEGDEA